MRANRDNRKYHNAMQPTQPSKSKREARRLGVQRFCIESRDISARGVTIHKEEAHAAVQPTTTEYYYRIQSTLLRSTYTLVITS